jgi:hypothetical protein
VSSTDANGFALARRCDREGGLRVADDAYVDVERRLAAAMARG